MMRERSTPFQNFRVSFRRIAKMRNAQELLDESFLEMRWRCLSLAADLDRLQRAEQGASVVRSDPRLAQLRQAIQVLLTDAENRAEQVQMIFSDPTPPPILNRKSQIA